MFNDIDTAIVVNIMHQVKDIFICDKGVTYIHFSLQTAIKDLPTKEYLLQIEAIIYWYC